MTALLLAIPVLPLLLGLAVAAMPFARPVLLRVAPVAVAPALIAAVIPAPDAPRELSWLLLGTRLGLDDTSQVFLLLTGAVWFVSLVYAAGYLRHEPRPERFMLFFLLTLAGNAGLLVAADVVTFYMSFAVMSFSTYGLVIHEQTDLAHRASRVYISMVIAAEFALLVGLVMATRAAGTTDLAEIPAAVAGAGTDHAIIGLLTVAFGVKLGLLGLHLWLPLAHPAAPTPASAVLSAVLVKAGLLGLLRFLPFGEGDYDTWGGLLVVVGFGGALFGVVWGVFQSDIKANLAYSTISQAGLMAAGAGVALMEPSAWPAILPALLVFAVHHSLAKGSLFLAVGVLRHPPQAAWVRRLLPPGIALAAMSLAGAPLTTGALGKTLLKGAAHPGGGWDMPIETLFFVSSAGTTVLMARFLWLARREWQAPAGEYQSPRSMTLAWLTLAALAIVAAWIVPAAYGLDVSAADALAPSKLGDATWPLLAGAAVVALALVFARGRVRYPLLPAGDIAGPLEAAGVYLVNEWKVRAIPALGVPSVVVAAASRRTLAVASAENLSRAEARLSEWGVFCVVLIAAVLLFFGLAQ